MSKGKISLNLESPMDRTLARVKKDSLKSLPRRSKDPGFLGVCFGSFPKEQLQTAADDGGAAA